MTTAIFLAATNMPNYYSWYGTITGATSTDLTISNGYSTGIYHGQFSYDNAGVHGVLTDFTEYRGTSPVTIVTGISVDAYAASVLIQNG